MEDNVNEDITWLPNLSDLCGFTEAKVRWLVGQMIEEGQLAEDQVEAVMEEMRIFYNGSRFFTQVLRKNAARTSVPRIV